MLVLVLVLVLPLMSLFFRTEDVSFVSCYCHGPNWRPSTAQFHDSWVGMDIDMDMDMDMRRD